MINYDHSINNHSSDAPAAVVPYILSLFPANSLLDVGCGTGVWMSAFQRHGVKDLFGVDGVPISGRTFLLPSELFSCIDLSCEWKLNRNFDLAICLEVAEHIEPIKAPDFIRCLCAHSDTIVFSAASPHQLGQHHVNLQWPSYWQELFNDNGFQCEDSIRPLIWDESFSEYWYKQNMFVARKQNNYNCNANEPRIPSLAHPEHLALHANKHNCLYSIINGKQGLAVALSTSAKMIIKALLHKGRIKSKYTCISQHSQ